MFFRIFAATVTLVSLSTVVSAEDMPRQLTQELIRTEHENCKTSTGYGMNFSVLRDVDGDGRRDVVLDYSEAQCGGQPEPYCDDAGCLLKVFLAGKGGGYKKAFDGKVRSWKIDESSGRPVLLIDGAPLAR